MKKVMIFLLVFILLGCSPKTIHEIMNDIKEDELNEIINSLSIDEKIGQLIMIDYSKDMVDDNLKSILETINPGGFILFSSNFTTYDRSINFIKEIKESAKIPMFIAIDQEGGNVQRLNSLKDVVVSHIPSMKSVGEKNDEELSYKVGKVIAEELRVFGINMDFAPVIDVLYNDKNKVIGDRAFGNNEEIVSRHGLKVAKGLSDNGVIPVFKHFPGHGSTDVDSHKDLPIINSSKEELLNSSIIPFKKAIEEDAKVIMVGHLSVPSITNSNTPASLSKEIITDFLRNDLGFTGIVITDALDMDAITKYYREDEICPKAFLAGADILLMPNNPLICFNSLKKAYDNGIISEEMINNSLKKIISLKKEKIYDTYNDYLSKDYLGSSEHQLILEKIKNQKPLCL